jgi:diketogulonate reductase-like aldo/keto reductase
METLRMKSGHEIPVLGMGTWNASGDALEKSLRAALEMGYRHIDTADWYRNHSEIGNVIRDIDRSELFITTKVHRADLAYGNVLRVCEKALNELSTEYIDLYLLHWPNDDIPIAETMKAMKRLVDEGKVRSVGVSNFNIRRTTEAIEASEVPVSVNQVEFHAHLYQKELLEFCRKKGVIVTAYCPVGRGTVLSDPVIKKIAAKAGRTPAQVALRWLAQHGLAVIPKSMNESHIKENMDIFGWELSSTDMESIDNIGVCQRLVNPVFLATPFFSRIPQRLLRRIPKKIKNMKADKNFFRD